MDGWMDGYAYVRTHGGGDGGIVGWMRWRWRGLALHSLTHSLTHIHSLTSRFHPLFVPPKQENSERAEAAQKPF